MWIPCSERIPTKCGGYIVCFERRILIATFHGTSFYNDHLERIEPIAWMPLPKPYIETQEEE